MNKKLLLSILLFVSAFSFAQTTVIDSIISGGIYRNYRVYIPAAYTGATARPLVFDLHGYTSNASAEQAYSNFAPIADTANVIFVYPNGTLDGSSQPYWNAGFGTAMDDIGFISNLIDTLKLQYNIDPDMIYSCGMSNGGYMSHTLACELSSKIAAIASVTGSMTTYQNAICSAGRPVPVMQISGDADGTVAYGGGAGSMGIDALVSYWVSNDGCNPTPAFSNIPNTSTTDGCTAEHYVYNGGINGSTCEKYKIIGGGHTWPGSPFIIGVTNQDFKASEKIWLFFRKYKLSQLTGINEFQISDSKFKLYPNPASVVITIEGEDIHTIRIYDVTGKLVLESKQTQIDISGLAKGVYSITISGDNCVAVKKLVKI